MALLPLWRRSPDEIRTYSLRQIVVMAGDGRVRDGSLCSTELRGFLRDVPPDDLERYTTECLEEGFDDSGFALQDVVNELGTRLEFDVEPGLYRGRKGQTGFDGIWRSDDGLEFLVEVKTTDQYNAHLDRIEGCRRELVSAGRLGEESAVLFVVGRQDTGALEAQIRGSRHAWMMRVIGAASLLRLVQVKLKSDSDSVTRRIKAILRPVEYTRVDGIADLVFDTTSEIDFNIRAEVIPPIQEAGPEDEAQQRAPSAPASAGIEEFRDTIAAALLRRDGLHLIRKRRSLYVGVDGSSRAIIAVSKRYEREHQAYWYAFYEAHMDFLMEVPSSYLVLGALDSRSAYVLPVAMVSELLSSLKFTVREQGQKYWHIAIRLYAGTATLTTNNGDVDLSPYVLSTDEQLAPAPGLTSPT